MIIKSYLFEKDVKKNDNKFFLFYGENQGLKKELKKKIEDTYDKAELTNFTQEDLTKNEKIFYEQFLNISLFSNLKIFFIDNVSDKILEIIQDLENKSDNQKIYLFAGILDKKSKLRNYFEKSKEMIIVPCYNDNEITIRSKIAERLKDYQGVNHQSINVIINSTGLDRMRVSNELDKIENYFLDKNIQKKDLFSLLNQSENESFDTLKNAAISGKNDKTNKLLSETIIENDKIIFYLSSINFRLNKLNEILSFKDSNIEEAIEVLKPPIFWKDKPEFIEQAKKWNTEKLQRMLNETFNLEIKLKSDVNLNKNILLKNLLVEICNTANS